MTVCGTDRPNQAVQREPPKSHGDREAQQESFKQGDDKGESRGEAFVFSQK